MKLSLAFFILFNIFNLGFNAHLKIKKETQSKSSTVPDAHNVLNINEAIQSTNKKYFAIMQADGKFAVYSSGPTNGKSKGDPLYETKLEGTGQGPFSLTLREDGNLVITDSKTQILWQSRTNGKGTKPYRLIIQDDGKLVISDKDFKIIWENGKLK